MNTNKLILTCEDTPLNTLQTLKQLIKRYPLTLSAELYLLAKHDAINDLKSFMQTNASAWKQFCASLSEINVHRLLRLIEESQTIELPSKDANGSYDECHQRVSTLIFWLSQDANSAIYILLSKAHPEVSYFLSYYLSAYGREQDYLLQMHSSDATHHQIVNIPFIVKQLKRNVLKNDSEQPKNQHTPSLIVNLVEKNIIINNRLIELSPTLFAWYSWLAVRRKYNTESFDEISLKDNLHLVFLKHFKGIYGTSHHAYMRVAEAIEQEDGFTVNYISEKKTRINSIIKKTINIDSYNFLIKSHGKRPFTKYGLALDPEDIMIID